MSGRTAIVTGGAGAIGAAIVSALRAEGWRAASLDMPERFEEPVEDGWPCDITDRASRKRALEAIGPVGALVNCAGIAAIIPALEVEEAYWRQVLEVNLSAPFFLAQEVAPGMAAAGGGAIVNIASVSGLRASYGRVAYGVSKAGLIHLTRQLAIELAPLGIRCNAVAPGPVESGMARSAHSPTQVSDYLSGLPQGRYGEPEEIASVVAFLCSEGARHVTGQCLPVDGGWTVAGVGVAEARNRNVPPK